MFTRNKTMKPIFAYVIYDNDDDNDNDVHNECEKKILMMKMTILPMIR